MGAAEHPRLSGSPTGDWRAEGAGRAREARTHGDGVCGCWPVRTGPEEETSSRVWLSSTVSLPVSLCPRDSP